MCVPTDGVVDYAARRVRHVVCGPPNAAIAVDPGVGFGKTPDHNLALLRHLDQIAALGHPVVVGVSRKSFLERLGGGATGDRLSGSIAAAAFALTKGAHVVRAHDVRETVRAVRVVDGMLRGEKL